MIPLSLISYYALAFLLAFLASVILTVLARRLAYHFNFVDQPSLARKIHQQPIAYLGGAAIFLAFLLILPWFVVLDKKILAFLLAGALLLIIGTIDDKYNLKPLHKLIWQALACLVVIAGGIGISSITNPLGGVIILDSIVFPFQLGDLLFSITLLADIFAFGWIMVMINTMNFLDGLDGLAAGVGTIGAFTVFILSLLPIVNQPQTAMIALILAGCILGFLVFNFHPASIFMGDGGSMLIGMSLATLSIIANGKIATTLLVLGLPLLDVVLVILRRIFIDHRLPWLADRKHFHHRLLSIGLNQRKSVIIVYIFCSIFGISALFLGSSQKLIALGIMALAIFSLFAIVLFLERKRAQPTNNPPQASPLLQP